MVRAYTTGPVRIRIGTPSLSVAAPRRDAAADEARVAAIMAALDAGDMDRASSLSEQALGSGLEHAAPLCVMAMAHELGGRFGEAIPYLMRALKLVPTDSSMMLALARCLLGLDRAGEALAVIEGALELAPSYANAHAFKGQALGRLSWLAKEEESYLRALELDPDNLIARAGLASLCSHFGEHRDARAHAEAVLEAAPDHADAALVLAVADIAEGRAVAAEARIRALIAEHGQNPTLTGHLADALDAQDRTAEAFEAYGDYGQALHRQHGGQYLEDNVLRAAERTASLLYRVPAGAWPKGGPERPEPAGVQTHVFLLGFARTGTSLLGLALEGDPQVEVLQEREPLTDALQHFAGRDGLERLLMAGEAELAPLRTAYWRRARAAGASLERKVFVDKQPMNSVNLPVIARLFPGAKILFALRDPRDVVLSCLRQRFLINRYTYHLLTAEGTARLYGAAMEVAERMQGLALLDTLTVRHEDLARDFDREMGRICRFLGLGWSHALRAFGGRVRARGVATPSASQLTLGLNSRGVGQWRRYARQLEPLAAHLAPWVERFGYDEGVAAGRGDERPWGAWERRFEAEIA